MVRLTPPPVADDDRGGGGQAGPGGDEYVDGGGPGEIACGAVWLADGVWGWRRGRASDGFGAAGFRAHRRGMT